MFLRRLSSILTTVPKTRYPSRNMHTGVPALKKQLTGLYDKTLKEIQLMPEDEVYRKNIESATRHRLDILNQEEDLEKIVQRIGAYRIEDLIEEANFELKIIGHMLEWDPWGVVGDDYIYDGDVFPQLPKSESSPLPPDFFETLESLALSDFKET